MAALQHATASAEVAAFLGCCDDVARKGTQTLSIHAICHRLDHLEAEWGVLTSLDMLTISARMQALQHYCDVYDACARTVPLPHAVWDRWAVGITSSFSTMDSPAASSPSQLETLRAELIMKYWGLYCQVHWGCACATKPRLAFAVEEARKTAAAVATATASAGSTAAVHTVESLEKLLAVPLHAFAQLTMDMSHLFGDYAVVGAVEREWLNEEVGLPLDPAADSAVEALVRRSFKRDLHIPSAALPALLRAYEETEVEERKAKEVLAVGAATLKSPWMRAASSLHEHLMNLSSTPTEAANMPSAASRPPLHDEKAYALLEDVVRELRRIPHNRGSLPALALLTHRIVEWGPAPTTSSAAAAALNPSNSGLSGSQTQFHLLLLHQWFAQYIASQHRWSVTDMFNAADDSDLWSFVLERHSFCLRWALASWRPRSEANSNHSGRSGADAQQSFMRELEEKVDKVRAIFYSVVHSLQLYRASVVSFANPEKREGRLAAACTAAQDWMARVGVPVFCRGLLGDLLDTTEEWEDTNCQPPRLQLWALQAEAELKIIMYDTMHLLGCPDNTTERLETLVQAALDLAAVWGETSSGEEEGGGESAFADKQESMAALLAPLVALVARVLQRIRAQLYHSVTTTSELSSADAELHQHMVSSVKKLISLAAAHVEPGELHALWDEYLFFVSLPAPLSTASTADGATASNPRSFPELLSYGFAARRALGTPSSSNGGIDDIAWERRSAFQLRRRRQEGQASTSAAAAVVTTEPAPPMKRPRTA